MLTAYLCLVVFACVLWTLGGIVAAIICALAALAIVLRYELAKLFHGGQPSAR